MTAPRLVLASASPRRAALLDQLGVSYTIEPAHIDEAQGVGEAPVDYVQRIAQEKARAVAMRFPSPGWVVLAADTSVVVDDTILGKPQDTAQASAFLSRLSGRWHTVLTAVCLSGDNRMDIEVVATEVGFSTLSQAVCAAYLATTEPWDKAGAYGIQGMGGAFVHSIRGSYTGVVGLPLFETWQLLGAHGIASTLTPVPLS